MKASEFKIKLKEIKELLRGISIQFVTSNSVRPINTLREFGLEVLEQEKRGNDFRISRAWTNEGTISISTFEQLKELFSSKEIRCVTVESYYEPKDFAEAIRYGFTLND